MSESLPFPQCCGLLTKQKLPIPLQGISVFVQVKGFVADVSATLKYKNKEENAVEAIFVFPMDEDSAVYSFVATIEGKKIVANLQEKKQAKETYDEAISQGQQAFLLEEDESSGDIFSISVGNLAPGQDAEVTMNYVRELPVEADGAVRFVLPAVLNPRYTPKGEKESITATLPNVPISDLPYTLSLNAQFQSAYGITKIESPCNITPIQYTNDDKTEAKVSLVEGHKFDRDVEILVYYNDVNRPSVTLESGLPDAAEDSFMAYPVAMLNFYPSFSETQEQSKCGEFIFVVDRSGSMDCPMNSEHNAPMRIQSAKETLVLLLKSLPLGCYFNIYGFGSTFESLFMESMEYTQVTLEAAVDKVNQMSADLGGTEILEPLKKIYKTGGRPQHPRQVFIFTDGEVENTVQVVAEVQRNAHNHRCFTFGIGEGASTALIKGMARAASGSFEFITGKDRLQPKVLKALKCALQPTIKEISLNWTLPPDVEQNLVSQAPTVLFQGQKSIVYVQFKGKLEGEKEARVALQYNYKEEIVTDELQFPLKFGNVERPTIHRLAAKNLISFLESEEESEEVKKMILETSLQSGVVSSLTAYVAVNKDAKTRVEGPPVQMFMPPVQMFMPPVQRFRPPVALSCPRPPMPPTPQLLLCYISQDPGWMAPVQTLELAVSEGEPVEESREGVQPDWGSQEKSGHLRQQEGDVEWEKDNLTETLRRIPESYKQPKEFVLPVIVHSCTLKCTGDEEKSMKLLIKKCQEITKTPPVVVITNVGPANNRSGDGAIMEKKFGEMGCTHRICLENYTASNHTKSQEADDQFLRFLHVCMNEAEHAIRKRTNQDPHKIFAEHVANQVKEEDEVKESERRKKEIEQEEERVREKRKMEKELNKVKQELEKEKNKPFYKKCSIM